MINVVQSDSSQPLLEAAFMIEQRVAVLRGNVREFYFAVMLFQRPCTRCGATGLTMLRDSWCGCEACRDEFDPTEAFQSCPECDGALIKKVCHYWCPACRKPVKSLFCFDARVFDADYFREMMRESRARKDAKVEEMRKLLAESRSAPHPPYDEYNGDLAAFTADLDQYVSVPVALEQHAAVNRPAFDMPLYRQHIQELVRDCIVDFDGISAVVQDGRLDRVFRFITVVFMEQDGLLEILQDHSGRIRLWGK
jgi:hypothetical protein